MNIFELLAAAEIAAYLDNLPAAGEPYLGEELFPSAQQAGTDISWLKGAQNLPVVIQPSNYDAKSSIRDRAGLSKVATEMAFFRESMRIGEKERQQLMGLLAQSTNLALPLITRLYDDAGTLVAGVHAQAEYMRMQLLQYGKFTVTSQDGNATYTYDYQLAQEQKYQAAQVWSNKSASTPLDDLSAAIDNVEARTGVRPTRIVMNRETFNQLVSSESVRKAMTIGTGLAGADVAISPSMVQTFVENFTQTTIVVYSRRISRFKNGVGPQDVESIKLIDDGIVCLLPATDLGHTWYGTTPEAFDLATGGTDAQVQVLANGPTITTYKEPHPVNVVTVVSAVMVPSFEQIDKVGVLTVK